jgi:cell wall-associated NlpC family hydrolase
VACALAALALLGPLAPDATAASGSASGPQGLGAFETLIDALGATRAERAVDAIGHGLAMMEAQKRIAATERKLAHEEATAAAEAEAEEAAAAEEVKDPAEMPPASAGSNGTTVPHSGGGKLFAHTRPGDSASTAILLSGVALAPPDAPEAVQQVINAANQIVGRPYVWGGGHASFYSYGYDCSGSVSFALHGAGLIPEPLTSGSLEGWGEPGPGKWITVYANADHTFMEIAGLRFDTVGDARGTGPRWHLMPNSTAGFVARHAPGL